MASFSWGLYEDVTAALTFEKVVDVAFDNVWLSQLRGGKSASGAIQLLRSLDHPGMMFRGSALSVMQAVPLTLVRHVVRVVTSPAPASKGAPAGEPDEDEQNRSPAWSPDKEGGDAVAARSAWKSLMIRYAAEAALTAVSYPLFCARVAVGLDLHRPHRFTSMWGTLSELHCRGVFNARNFGIYGMYMTLSRLLEIYMDPRDPPFSNAVERLGGSLQSPLTKAAFLLALGTGVSVGVYPAKVYFYRWVASQVTAGSQDQIPMHFGGPYIALGLQIVATLTGVMIASVTARPEWRLRALLWGSSAVAVIADALTFSTWRTEP